jgi:hypothetical protein
MNITVSHQSQPMSALAVPDFYEIRYELPYGVYQEAFLQGCYYNVGGNSLGRPASREQIWERFRIQTPMDHVFRNRQIAFQLQCDGQDLHYG